MPTSTRMYNLLTNLIIFCFLYLSTAQRTGLLHKIFILKSLKRFTTNLLYCVAPPKFNELNFNFMYSLGVWFWVVLYLSLSFPSSYACDLLNWVVSDLQWAGWSRGHNSCESSQMRLDHSHAVIYSDPCRTNFSVAFLAVDTKQREVAFRKWKNQIWS